MNDFEDRLLAWYEQHGRRDLPWQHPRSPYRVWVSEVMLQQTQVSTVIPYFERFMASFPDVAALADATFDAVLEHWAGLGYYARARNLHGAAAVIRDRHDGEFPRGFEEVVALPGIGRSTAGAILAQAFDERHAILDGNVKRVLARFHAIEGPPTSARVLQALWERAEQHTPAQRAADYTQAIMDLGATLCTRTKPRCGECPLESCCAAHALGRETDFPGRKAKKAKPLRVTHMVLVRAGNELFLERRPASGIWGGLWSLPEVAASDAIAEWCRSRLGAEPASVSEWQTLRHSFSHYDLDIRPVEVQLPPGSRTVADGDAGRWYDLGSPPGVGVAAPVRILIDTLMTKGAG
ncbi:MAG: A/G-specific adenine glycosylase [Gammaproteobacteria bacterium]|nr:A/G-specific adenine glycosylase [Gammaproteobacteria bacterium]